MTLIKKMFHPFVAPLHNVRFEEFDHEILDMNFAPLSKTKTIAFTRPSSTGFISGTGIFNAADIYGNIWITADRLYYDPQTRMYSRLLCIPHVICETVSQQYISCRPSSDPQQPYHVTNIT